MSNVRLVIGARLQRDEIRQQYILLLPEGALLLNSTAAAVLELCDGEHTQDEIVTELVEIYKNENVGKDVERLLSRLRDRGLIVDGVGENINNVRSPSFITSSLTNAKDIPFTLIAELTYRCPLRCPYCSNPVNYNDTQELPTEDWLRVIEQARSIGVWQLGFSGGEPLLRQDLEVLIAKAANTGLYTTLVTAGTLFTPERATNLARQDSTTYKLVSKIATLLSRTILLERDRLIKRLMPRD